MFKKLLLPLTAGLAAIPALAQDLYIEDAWVRALPPVKNVTAAYMVVVNDSDSAAAVVGGRADIAGSVEIHRSREVDGYMRMEQLPGFAVAAGERVELAPGGTHLMLMDLSFMPQPGDTVTLCLELAGGAEVCTEADTRKTASGDDGHQHEHH